MSLKSELQASRLDTAKLAFAAVLLAVAIVAFYYFADYSTLVRVLGLLVSAGVAVGVIATTAIGGSLIGFFQESRTELRKVVWPSRTETLQVSLAVVAMVLIMGIFLWLFDMLLFWIVRSLTG